MTEIEEASCLKGDSVKMVAKLDGIPRPALKVQKDGVEIMNDEHVQLVQEADIIELHLKNVTLESAGRYSIEARNEAGCAMTENHLRIIGNWSLVSIVKLLQALA